MRSGGAGGGGFWSIPMPPQPFMTTITATRITPIESRRESLGFLIGDGQDATLFQSAVPRVRLKMLFREFLLLFQCRVGVLAILRLIRNYQYSAMAFMYIACCFMA